ncbi:MAG TPA: alpha/beta hydrolase [Gemmatimonadales bacterium]
MRGEFLDVGGARLYYYAAGARGSGPPVVLLHGFPTSSHLWTGVASALAEHHRVLVLDMLGFGRSDRPGTHAVTVRAHAERVVELLDMLRIERAGVVGHDMGGGVAQLLAVRWPTRVSHLALVNSIAFDCWPVSEMKLARAMLPLTRQLPAAWILSAVRRDLLRGYVEQERGAHSLDMYLRPFTSTEGRDSLMAHLAQLHSSDTVEAAARHRDIVAPTAIVWGEQDPWFAPAIGERLQRSIPGSSLHVVPDVRHFVPEEAPQQVAAVVSDLMSR